MKNSVNHPTSIAAASLLIGLSTLLVNVSPVMIGAAAKAQILPDDQLGMLIAPGLIAVFLVSPIMVRWARGINWKYFVAMGSGLSALSFFLAAQSESLYAMLICFFFAGLGNGILYSIGMCCLGDGEEPDRGFGCAAIVQTLVSAAMMYLIPVWITPSWGFDGLMMVFSLIGAISICLILWFPSRGKSITHISTVEFSALVRDKRSSILPWVAMLALYFFFTGTSTLWAYYERFASDLNFSESYIAETLSIIVMVGGLGAFIPAILGSRFKRLWMIFSTNFALILIVLQLLVASEENLFFTFSLLFYLCISIALPYYFAAIAALDIHGKVVVLLPAVIALSAATGTMLAGPLYAVSSLTLLLTTSALIGIGLLIHIVISCLELFWVDSANPQIPQKQIPQKLEKEV
jgi:predicted MFS family arabinose efflux permease